MKTRPYRISRAGSDDVVLVRAANKEQALRHVIRNQFHVSLATDDDIYTCGKRGAQIEDATNDKETTA